MARISIGVPVHSGAEHLARSLECLRGQTFADFEVIVSDNASTDDSRAIAEEFAARDPRFRVVSQPENLGAVGNFLATLEMATAPFFMWRAHDDVSDANYLEALHGLLAAESSAVLAVGVVDSADHAGNRPRRRDFPTAPLDVADSVRLLFGSHPSWYYGLWRTAYLKEAFPRVAEAYPVAWAQDYLLLFPVLLSRRIVGTAATTFYQRTRVVVRDTARRRREAMSPQLRMEHRRLFRRACLAELERMDLPLAERLMARALLPFYVNRSVHKVSTVVKGYVRQKLGIVPPPQGEAPASPPRNTG